MSARPATAPADRSAAQRWGRWWLLAVYVWIAGLFPAVHAAAEQADRAPAPWEESSPGLPSGHDHLTCHACAAAVSLPAGDLVAVPHDAVSAAARPSTASAARFASDLAWYRIGIPPRAPPAC